MNFNNLYEKIVDNEGNCFDYNMKIPCQNCPFFDKCLKVMINDGTYVSNRARLDWALSALVDNIILGDDIE